jgi:hypothetical protein
LIRAFGPLASISSSFNKRLYNSLRFCVRRRIRIAKSLRTHCVCLYSCFEKIVSGQDRSSCKFPFNTHLWENEVEWRPWRPWQCWQEVKEWAELSSLSKITKVGVLFFELQKHSLLTKFSYRMFNESLDWTWVLLALPLNRVETTLWYTQKEMGQSLVSLHSTVMWSPP